MGHIVAMLNQKGGVGKTSTCHHLAGTMAKMGRRVLLVDNDPQSSLTQGFWGPDALHRIDPAETIVTLYNPDVLPTPAALIRPTGVDGVWLVPGSPHAARFNRMDTDRWAGRETSLRAFLDASRDDYDWVLIDNPPNLHLCSVAALVASDGLVVPLQAEDYGAQGLGPVCAAVEAVRAGLNPGLRLLGYLLTMFDRRLGIHLSYEAVLRGYYGADVFSTTIPLATDFKEAVASRQPVGHYKPRSAAAKAVRALAEELTGRVAACAVAEEVAG
ncbi:MAG: ParA family protein [Planctomycetaceae bacterium]